MLMLALICLSFALVGIVGLQFTYLFYVERIYRERRKHLQAVESSRRELKGKLEAANKQIREQNDLLKKAYPGWSEDESVWADVIDDR